MRVIDCSTNRYPDCCVQALPANRAAAPVVAAEHWMEIWLQDRPAMRVVCTPEHLDELAVGRLLTEGLIADPDDIEELYICEYGLRARITLRPEARAPLAEAEAPEVASCCTDNRTLLRRRLEEAGPVRPIPWEPEWLIRLQEKMRGGEPLYEATHAVHACYLARGEELLCCREDIGRHNALDKVVGWAALQGIDLRECLLFTTGRMPSDMVSKAIRSRVPILVSKTFPTDQGLRLARQARLTLITVRGNGELIVWTDGSPENDE